MCDVLLVAAVACAVRCLLMREIVLFKFILSFLVGDVTDVEIVGDFTLVLVITLLSDDGNEISLIFFFVDGKSVSSAEVFSSVVDEGFEPDPNLIVFFLKSIHEGGGLRRFSPLDGSSNDVINRALGTESSICFLK